MFISSLAIARQMNLADPPSSKVAREREVLEKSKDKCYGKELWVT